MLQNQYPDKINDLSKHNSRISFANVRFLPYPKPAKKIELELKSLKEQRDKIFFNKVFVYMSSKYNGMRELFLNFEENRQFRTWAISFKEKFNVRSLILSQSKENSLGNLVHLLKMIQLSMTLKSLDFDLDLSPQVSKNFLSSIGKIIVSFPFLICLKVRLKHNTKYHGTENIYLLKQIGKLKKLRILSLEIGNFSSYVHLTNYELAELTKSLHNLNGLKILRIRFEGTVGVDNLKLISLGSEIKEKDNIEELFLEFLDHGKSCLGHLRDHIGGMNNLKTLKITAEKGILYLDDMKFLSKSLLKLNQLKNLSIAFNDPSNFSEIGYKKIVETLVKMMNLKILEICLDFNGIKFDFLSEFFRILAQNNCFKKLMIQVDYDSRSNFAKLTDLLLEICIKLKSLSDLIFKLQYNVFSQNDHVEKFLDNLLDIQNLKLIGICILAKKYPVPAPNSYLQKLFESNKIKKVDPYYSFPEFEI